jgi:predicted dehydrogenase
MNEFYFRAKNSSNPFRWGILGTGWMAGIFAKELRLHPEAEISAVASRGSARAAAFASEHGIPRHFDSYQALVNCDDIEIVYDASSSR